MALNTDYIFLSIYMKHRVRDMSVGNSFDNKMAPIPYADLRAGEEIDCSRIRGGKVRVVDVVPERITLEAEGKTYELELEEKVGCGDYAVDNPFVSLETIELFFYYEYRSPYNQAIWVFDYVRRCHSVTTGSVNSRTTKYEKKVLNLLNRAGREGYTDAYVLKALLDTCNNWSTMVICRMSQFKGLLLQAVRKGALGPDHDLAWQVMGMAATNNDPNEFIDDKDLYYDLLATAAEEGCDEARDIMNEIWPPEQIIEED